MPKKSITPKYDVICGIGQHRSYTAALAEIILLNKYGNLQDHFWYLEGYRDEYVKLIKLAGKVSKEVGRDKFAYFLYKNQDFKFDGDIGLIIWKMREDSWKNAEFTLQELVKIYKEKFRPSNTEPTIIEKEIKAPAKNNTIRDFLGDI